MDAADETGLLRQERVEAFRWAMSTLGLFDRRNALVTRELQDLSKTTLVGNPYNPIAVAAKDFPLDRVRITRSGVLHFTGGAKPVQIWGPISSHFIPTPVVRTGRRASNGGLSTTTPNVYTVLATAAGPYPGVHGIDPALGGVYQVFSAPDCTLYAKTAGGSQWSRVDVTSTPPSFDSLGATAGSLPISHGGAADNAGNLFLFQPTGFGGAKKWTPQTPGDTTGTLTPFGGGANLFSGVYDVTSQTLYAGGLDTPDYSPPTGAPTLYAYPDAGGSSAVQLAGGIEALTATGTVVPVALAMRDGVASKTFYMLLVERYTEAASILEAVEGGATRTVAVLPAGQFGSYYRGLACVGSHLYVTEKNNWKLYKLDLTAPYPLTPTEMFPGLAARNGTDDGPTGKVAGCFGLALDPTSGGKVLWLGETLPPGNGRIRKITLP